MNTFSLLGSLPSSLLSLLRFDSSAVYSSFSLSLSSSLVSSYSLTSSMVRITRHETCLISCSLRAILAKGWAAKGCYLSSSLRWQSLQTTFCFWSGVSGTKQMRQTK